MKKNKLLHIVGSMDPSKGGVTEAINLISTGLDNYGIENDVVSLDENTAHFIEKSTKNIIALGKGKTPWQYNKQLDIWLAVHSNEYEIVIVHGLWLYISFSVYNTLLKSRVSTKPKVYVMPHGMLDPYFQKAKGRRIKAWRNIFFWKNFESKLINSSDGILFTCEEEKRLAFLPFKPYNPKATKIVGIGLDKKSTDDLIQKCSLTHNQSSYWLYLGRIDEKKGVDVLISSYLSLQDKFKLPRLIIAGPGWDTEYGIAIKKQIENNFSIDVKSMVVGVDKWKLICGAELFILPSHQENFGITLVESLACSVPVLTTKKVNIFREILEGGAGLITDDNKLAIEESLKSWFLLDKEKQLAMKKNARILFETKFNLEISTKKLVEAIWSVK